jgi:sugar phosphate isomerase/epimerase
MRRTRSSEEKRSVRLAAVGHDRAIIIQYSLQPTGSASFKGELERLLDFLEKGPVDLLVLDGREETEEAIRKHLEKRSLPVPAIVVLPGLIDSNEELSLAELLRRLGEAVEAGKKRQGCAAVSLPTAEEPAQPKLEASPAQQLSERQERLAQFLDRRLNELRAQNKPSADS